MKLDIGQTISMLANFGVLAGILLLAFELNQNNRFAEEQAEYAALQESLRMNELIVQPDLAPLYYRSVYDEPLSQLDRQRRSTLIGGMFSQWQWMFARRPDSLPTSAFVKPRGASLKETVGGMPVIGRRTTNESRAVTDD